MLLVRDRQCNTFKFEIWRYWNRVRYIDSRSSEGRKLEMNCDVIKNESVAIIKEISLSNSSAGEMEDSVITD